MGRHLRVVHNSLWQKGKCGLYSRPCRSQVALVEVRYSQFYDTLCADCFVRVYVDDVDVRGVSGGTAYSTFGISPNGAVVVVRPDGYVGRITPLDDVRAINGYFAQFISPSH